VGNPQLTNQNKGKKLNYFEFFRKIQNASELVKMKHSTIKSAEGFSILELVIVLTIIMILSLFTFMSLGSEKLYNTDKQALKITDLLQEARQRSLSQRKTMRVEINQTKKSVRLIDEKDIGNANDDREIKSVSYSDNSVYVGTAPSNMSATPTEVTPVSPISFSTSNHPLSSNDKVATMRFLKNGTVTNAGSDAIGTGAVPTGATIYVWSKFPKDSSTTPTTAQIFRAVTVLGTRGSTRIWKCLTTNGQCTEWVN